MPVIAIIAAIAFIAGFGLSNQIDKAEIKQMSNDITAQNTLAETTLREATQKVKSSVAAAIKLNLELDKSHDSFINTATAYDKQLDSIRLYANSGACSRSSDTESDSTGISEEAAGESEFSEELDRLIKTKARICDEAADYADKSYQFATLNNCGIAH